jgi:hypothetical protein
MADSRTDTDARSEPPRPLTWGDAAQGLTESAEQAKQTNSEAAQMIRDELENASNALDRTIERLEVAKEMAVNHPVVPGALRAEIDHAYDEIYVASEVFTHSVEIMDKTIAYRLGNENLCDECGAGAVTADAQPWHYPGCDFKDPQDHDA